MSARIHVYPQVLCLCSTYSSCCLFSKMYCNHNPVFCVVLMTTQSILCGPRVDWGEACTSPHSPQHSGRDSWPSHVVYSPVMYPINLLKCIIINVPGRKLEKINMLLEMHVLPTVECFLVLSYKGKIPNVKIYNCILKSGVNNVHYVTL